MHATAHARVNSKVAAAYAQTLPAACPAPCMSHLCLLAGPLQQLWAALYLHLAGTYALKEGVLEQLPRVRPVDRIVRDAQCDELLVCQKGIGR